MTQKWSALAREAGLKSAKVEALLEELLAPPFGKAPAWAWNEFVQAGAKLELDQDSHEPIEVEAKVFKQKAAARAYDRFHKKQSLSMTKARRLPKKLPFRLEAVGIPSHAHDLARACVYSLLEDGIRAKSLRRLLKSLVRHPAAFVDHPVLAPLAHALGAPGPQSMWDKPVQKSSLSLREEPAPWTAWGEDLDPQALEQMEQGCSLPVAVRGALMPDAHVGYGLPIGGVLAVDNAVIPYGVGMDIACRMRLSVFALPPDLVKNEADALAHILEAETCFGVGGKFRQRKDHAVMHEDWSFSPVTAKMHDTAWAQLGTSGSGNHFVEWGVLDVPQNLENLESGVYLALLSHSGSRGTGGEVCRYYSSLARRLRPDLPRALGHLAWLDLDSDPGQEYWAAMELMGRYSAANHALIHDSIAKHLGVTSLWSVENHHNFAWIEVHEGQKVVVHRKGATPAMVGTLGVIPGTMVDPTFVVEGLGNPLSLYSAAHGAGRAMSRKEALRRFRRSDLEHILRKHEVRLLSSGLDEVPMAYKDIHTVMAAQTDLVRVRATFTPRIVKMARS